MASIRKNNGSSACNFLFHYEAEGEGRRGAERGETGGEAAGRGMRKDEMKGRILNVRMMRWQICGGKKMKITQWVVKHLLVKRLVN